MRVSRGLDGFISKVSWVIKGWWHRFRCVVYGPCWDTLVLWCTAWCICIWTIFESGCGIQVSQATPTKFSMLFKHNYGKLSWKFGDHSLNFSFVHGPSWLKILESIHRYGVIFTFCKIISKRHCETMPNVKKNILYWLLKVFAWIFYWSWNFLF